MMQVWYRTAGRPLGFMFWCPAELGLNLMHGEVVIVSWNLHKYKFTEITLKCLLKWIHLFQGDVSLNSHFPGNSMGCWWTWNNYHGNTQIYILVNTDSKLCLIFDCMLIHTASKWLAVKLLLQQLKLKKKKI